MADQNLRYELKLSCAAHLLDQARSWIKLHPAGFRQAYPQRRVNNLYFDSLQLHSLHANISGLSERKKLRLRWYGPQTSSTTNPTLELKVKDNLLGGKKQEKLNCTIDWSMPFSTILPLIRSTAGKSWRPHFSIASQPTLINSYSREYFVTLDGIIRVTLDYNQVAYSQRLSQKPVFNRPLLDQDIVVIEIKGPAHKSHHLETIMRSFPLRRQRNSKYVNGMLAQPL